MFLVYFIQVYDKTLSKENVVCRKYSSFTGTLKIIAVYYGLRGKYFCGTYLQIYSIWNTIKLISINKVQYNIFRVEYRVRSIYFSFTRTHMKFLYIIAYLVLVVYFNVYVALFKDNKVIVHAALQ